MIKHNYTFELSEIVIAERLGRCMVEKNPPLPGEKIAILTECSTLGAAGLAAARHYYNCAGDVTVYMSSPEAQSCSTFATMLEVAGCMDIPLRLLNGGKPDETNCGKFVLASELPSSLIQMPALAIADYNQSDAWDALSAGSKPETLLHTVETETPALSCEAVTGIDKSCIEEYGLPGICLMENAGIGAVKIAKEMLLQCSQPEALVITGRGNNGGDGLVVARGLLEQGIPVEVALLCSPARLGKDAFHNYEILTNAGFNCLELNEDGTYLEKLCAKTGLLIDGVLGTGITGKVHGFSHQVIAAINASGKPVLALDLPSGLDADTGEVLGVAVAASKTVTFAAVKQGLKKAAGLQFCGKLILADIGAPKELLSYS